MFTIGYKLKIEITLGVSYRLSILYYKVLGYYIHATLGKKTCVLILQSYLEQFPFLFLTKT